LIQEEFMQQREDGGQKNLFQASLTFNNFQQNYIAAASL
jgi:hypothetical protein